MSIKKNCVEYVDICYKVIESKPDHIWMINDFIININKLLHKNLQLTKHNYFFALRCQKRYTVFRANISQGVLLIFKKHEEINIFKYNKKYKKHEVDKNG